MLNIITPPRFKEEKEYVYSVVLKEFLGIPYRVEFTSEGNSTVLQAALSKKQFTLPEVLFSTAANKWLTPGSLPLLPLKQFPIAEGAKDFMYPNIPVLYGEEGGSSDLPVDIFGSVFFLLTRYEECLNNNHDGFGRFPPEESVMVKAELLHRPLVNEYMQLLSFYLEKILELHIPVKREYSVALSHDVDWPVSINDSFTRYLRSCTVDVLKRKSLNLALRRTRAWVLKDYQCDPYNNFSYIMDVSESANIKSAFNFIPINGNGGIDGNYDIASPSMRNVLKSIHSREHEIGFHPSYHTFLNEDKTEAEFKRLLEVCETSGIEQETWGGRQHYLRWRNPVSWGIWDRIGLDYDSSVSYETAIGFRCGTCFDFSTFNLLTKEHYKLVERPLVLMDVSVFLAAPSKEMEIFKQYSDICRFYRGSFNVLYHNNYILSEAEKEDYKMLIHMIS